MNDIEEMAFYSSIKRMRMLTSNWAKKFDPAHDAGGKFTTTNSAHETIHGKTLDPTTSKTIEKNYG